MKLLGWLLLIGGSVLSVTNAFMLVMQAALWLTGHRSSWPPMGLSVYWGAKLNTGWAALDIPFNTNIPTVLMVLAASSGLLLAILGMKIVDKIDRTR
jgi:hypothetical protein